jgi:hypothetical protein
VLNGHWHTGTLQQLGNLKELKDIKLDGEMELQIRDVKVQQTTISAVTA